MADGTRTGSALVESDLRFDICAKKSIESPGYVVGGKAKYLPDVGLRTAGARSLSSCFHVCN